ncbi:spore coat U domain-containing protein [Acinetobacter sp. AG3]|jgi:spore coat protein U-like protein|uniref:Csu type fimbrial protein n=1 Tax=unclassified Acinetobacter TaxID=196816 RepID=UPI001EF0B331|nr:spore coat U domain-containing protein [Acinetobacter sp. AG3]MCG7221820.1 spore coat U domain-containing protein [Acinetobacter sp. AG3]
MKKIGLSVLLMLAVQWVYAETEATFTVQATIANGCGLSSVEQQLDFGRHPVVAQGKLSGSVINTTQSWNIQCTARLPVKVMLNGGDHFSNNFRRMKHAQQNEFVSYQLYQDSNSQREYTSGDTYPLTATTALDTVLGFAVYAVADLNNNNQPRSAGLYKDTVAITITW